MIGERVRKRGGDYRFTGIVVAEFYKLNGKSVRVVVENEDGILHIFNPTQLEILDANKE